MGRLGGVLGRLVASWKCLGASQDRTYCFLKVKSLKILIFEGFNEILGGAVGGGCRRGRPDSGPLRVYKVQCMEVKVCR